MRTSYPQKPRRKRDSLKPILCEMLNLLRNQTLLQSRTFPQFESMTDFSFLSLPAVVVKLFSIETEYLWFFSKRHAAPLPASTDNSVAAVVVFYTNHTESLWHLITSFVVKAHFENCFVKRLLPVFKYFPFSKEKAPKELTNPLALLIYKYPLNHHYFSMIIYIIWY